MEWFIRRFSRRGGAILSITAQRPRRRCDSRAQVDGGAEDLFGTASAPAASTWSRWR
jgi:hypothetical protein